MNLPDFLVQGELGEVRISGHRIDLLHVVERYREGFSPEMLREQFPTLPLALIHKVLAFYLENQKQVEAYVTRERALIDEAARTAGTGLSLQELRRRANVSRRAETPNP